MIKKIRAFGLLAALCVNGHAAGDAPAPARQPRGIMGDLDSDFRNPPNQYRVVQYSGHEGALLPIAKMREYGIGGVELFLSKHNYLRNEEAWANMKTNIREAKKAGMQVWVCDENGYPSPQAGGLVVAADPEFELRVLAQLSQRGNGPKPARIDLPPGAEKFVRATLYPVTDGHPDYDAGTEVPVQGDSIQNTGLPGQWALYAFVQRINNDAGSPSRGTMAGFNTTGHYPNLLDPGAMAKFVDLTHAEYARRLGPLAGQIDLFYTNEPHLGSMWHAAGQRPGGAAYLPWHASLPGRFRKEHGYDLMPFLPALYEGTGDQAKLVRRHFFQTVGNMFAENFSGRIARWCEGNGVKSGGHLFGEERMDLHVSEYGNLFQALQQQQAPGCDVAMPSPNAHWNYWMPTLARSAAQLQGRETVTCLIDPLIDRGGDTSLMNARVEQIMRIMNMAFFCGVNHMSCYLYWDQYAPEDYRKLNEQIGRLAVMLRGARNVSTVAMYYPIESFQCTFRPIPGCMIPITIKSKPAGYDPQIILMEETQEQIIPSLFENGYDFSWLDGEAVLRAEIRDGRLVIGAHAYTTLIMPRVELLPLAVLQKLQQFEKSGGKVLWVDTLPRLGDKAEEHAQVQAAVAASRAMAPEAVVSYLGPAFPENFRLRLDGKPAGLFITRWLQKGRCVNFVVNAAHSPLTATLRLEGQSGGKLWVYNPADGSIAVREAAGPLTLAPNSALFLIEDDETRMIDR